MNSKDPYFVLGSSIQTLVVGSLIFIVAFAWSEFAQISFQRYGGRCNILQDRSEEFHDALRYALFVTILALLIIFLVMYYINGEKW